MQSKLAMFLLGATLALGFAFSSYLISHAIVKFKNSEIIKVKGSASRQIKADFGTWTGVFEARSPELAKAYAELESSKAKVEALVKAKGFEQAEVKFDKISIREERKIDDKGRQTNAIEAYLVSQPVVVSTFKVAALEELSRSFTELIKDGVYADAQEPSFIVTKLDQFKMDLLAEATRNGAERARVLASSSGGKVGRLVSASQGIFQITRPASGETSDEGAYDKSTIDKELKAVVTLEFASE